MKQTILAVIRPSLNLAVPENQLAHLAEHILLSPVRQQQIGLDRFIPNTIIFSQGYITELYCAEFYVVIGDSTDRVAEIITNHQAELGITEEIFQSSKKALIQELQENKNSLPSLAEQFERAIYTEDSPSVRNPWFDGSKITKSDQRDVVSVFNDYREPTGIISLSQHKYQLPKNISVNRNTLRPDIKKIELTHPDQKDGLVEVSIIIPIESTVANPGLLDIYLHSLADFHLGLLSQELRHKAGYVYWVEAFWNLFSNSIQIRFSTSAENQDKAVAVVTNCLEHFSSKMSGRFQDLAFQAKVKRELDWGRISDYSLRYIEEVILGGVTKSPQEIAESIQDLTVHELNRFNKKIYDYFLEKGLIVYTRHGEEPTAKHFPC